MREIGESLYCDASYVTDLVDRLEERGLIERRRRPERPPGEAGRAHRRPASGSASAALELLYEPPAEFAALDAGELATLSELLAKAAAADSAADRPGPVSGRLASDAVHTRLRADILEGRLGPGDAVPSERALAEELGVNRHAVREALKRLQQAGLIRISQGGATRVLDWRESGGLEVLLDLMDAPGDPPAELMRSVLEMRESVGVDAAGQVLRAGERRDLRATRRGPGRRRLRRSGPAAGPRRLHRALAGRSSTAAATSPTGSALNSLNGALDAYPRSSPDSLIPTDPRPMLRGREDALARPTRRRRGAPPDAARPDAAAML